VTETTTAAERAHAGFATSADPGGDGLVEQVVVAHIYCWLTLRPASLGVPGQFDHHRSYRGDTIWVSPAERDRGQSFGALADPKAAARAQAEFDGAAVETYSDDELREMDAGELAGYVVQHPGEAQRVYDLEQQRPENRRRKTVIRATGYDPETGERLPDDGSGPGAGDDDAPGGPAAVG
jgi:hypothetical protein